MEEIKKEKPKINSLSSPCVRSSVDRGGTLNLSIIPSGGIQPYNITFYKISPGSTQKQILFTDTNVPNGENREHLNVPIPWNEQRGIWTYGIDGIDSCSTPTLCNPTCDIQVNETICSLIVNLGGTNNITIPSIFILVDAYTGFVDIGFTPTIIQILGYVDYYLGFTSSGNSKTGCNF